MDQPQLIPHLFRTEFRKITSVLVRLLGVDHIDAAEDIASETFELALESWPYKGIPENPVAWLYAVAKNKAKNHIKRHQLFAGKISGELQLTSTILQETDIDLSDKNISDSQLQMLFVLCHPSIPAEAQIGLSLRLLCGFGIDEIANAFLTSKEVINKRLFRAKEKLRLEKIAVGLPADAEIGKRLETVLTTLYLLFNEGYYSESKDSIVREDLCLEAMRLTHQLIENDSTNRPAVNALFALMCFHSSRFAARKDVHGELILYQDQNEELWSQELIEKGVVYLYTATRGNVLSRYHIEASIAYWHTRKADTTEKWESILHLYNQLLMMEYSAVAALNRTYAYSKVAGKAQGITEAEKLKLEDNPFYFALLGELYTDIDNQKAKQYFGQALKLAKTSADKAAMKKKMDHIAS